MHLSPFEPDTKHYRRRLVKTRKEHLCVGCYTGIQHKIPKGTKAHKELGFLDGKPVTCYLCMKCYDQYIDDLYDEDDITDMQRYLDILR